MEEVDESRIDSHCTMNEIAAEAGSTSAIVVNRARLAYERISAFIRSLVGTKFSRLNRNHIRIRSPNRLIFAVR
jgi:hypothetical protein